MQTARKILFPFSVLYGGITTLRNYLYDHNFLKSTHFDVPVICVGNLSVGGTGKSPMVEMLVRMLKTDYKLAILSRGYKRTSSGFYLLQGTEKAAETGDEPLQFKLKFPEVTVAVDENRTHGIEQLLKLIHPEVILLDDAFQHRKVRAGLNILLTSYQKLYTKDWVLPAGNLREPRAGAKRAQIIVVTKCSPRLDEDEKEKILQELNSQGQKVFFSTVKYQNKVFNKTDSRKLQDFGKRDFSLVTGIANPQPLVDFLKQNKFKFRHLKFPDHHHFTPSEVKKIGQEPLILTTEKDYMRLKNLISEEKLFYLPIETEFLEGEATFEEIVKSYINRNNTN